MPKAKYEPIYKQIKEDIVNGKYKVGEYLPSENTYADRYACTRNTVRRALGILTNEGYIIPQHGKGVQVIYDPTHIQNIFTVGGIESFDEARKRTNANVQTVVKIFQEIICDEQLSLMTGFDIGSKLYYIERIRIIDQIASIFDTNIFLASEAEGLTPEIAQKSIYNYLENNLHMSITTSRRRVTAEDATPKDEEYLNLDSHHFVLVVTGQVFNSKEIMFEYTQSRHRPDKACFVESATRQSL